MFNTQRIKIEDHFDIVDDIDTFKDFKRIAPQDVTLLGAPVLKEPAVNLALQNKVNDLHRPVGRLALLHSHDALKVLLRNSGNAKIDVHTSNFTMRK